MSAMAQREVRQQVYDHRLRALVRQTGDMRIATAAGVPRSTAAGWLRRELHSVVSADVLDMAESDLRAEVVKLRCRVRTLSAVLGLLRAAGRARKVLPTSAVLKILGISSSRYTAWVRAEQGCDLDDRATCPRSTPTQLTPDEVRVIHAMVASDAYRHVPTGRLALLAQRMGKVFASPSTWYRPVRDRDWRRPRSRQHPASPRIGVRAKAPDEIWHVDTSACV